MFTIIQIFIVLISADYSLIGDQFRWLEVETRA